MHVKLSKGDAKVWVKFDHDGFLNRRTTTITLTLGEETVSAVAVCSRRDNFCKRTGRKLALHKLLYGHAKGRAMSIATKRLITSATFNADDRRKLWQAVCPEFFKGKEVESISFDAKEELSYHDEPTGLYQISARAKVELKT